MKKNNLNGGARATALAAALLTGLALSACGGGGDVQTPLPTLGGLDPLVIGHRGLPGLFPEETGPSYEGAADAGADSLELDLHLTKDCVLVARHNPWLSDNTNIAEVAKTNAVVAARKRTVPGVLVPVKYDAAKFGGPASYLSDLTNPADPKSVLKSLVVDGEDHTNDWSISDFTAAELKQWLGGTSYDNAADRVQATAQNGKYPVLTFQEVIDIAVAKSKAKGRSISVYPELKNPIWNNGQAKANGCGSGDHAFEDIFLKQIRANNLDSKGSALLVQSFDPATLKYLRAQGMKATTVQLIDGNDVDYKTGAMIYEQPNSDHFVSGRPYSWTLAGDPRYFGVMLTPAGLAEIATYADAIGPWKPEVMLLTSPDGKGGAKAVNKAVPNSVIADAHKLGLAVHVFTFRSEAGRLAGVYGGDPVAEYLTYFRAGVDGVFSDFAGTAFEARKRYLQEMGR
ncbi:glycerophosphodiester phosphodiesterase family protein [Paucibacter sp. KCTC 42545]|uniref:glycerophosphodiester phosphodiesterase family protein n=1 Tax=Paucibacter sp. KCTC 42545 TaxID=1768242 RepID=UPI000733BE19|nr:glycerophosphodiester phosphodiesterase family protein [Paucibacter sp. KCTC 42545]ALT79387.1 glycerophosphodiester phosphodiesterase [Paucibacter sp. KCTC 42545]